MIAYLIPVLLLEFGLLIFALVDLSRRPRTNGPKWVWVLVIVVVQVLGPLLYFLFGRREE